MITVLGAAGSLDKGHECTAFLLGDAILIDAGHVMQELGQASTRIEHVFLTHAHFDHLRDLPFLVETHFDSRRQPLKVYALAEVIDSLKRHIFNDVIWPAFHAIHHAVCGKPMLEFVEIKLEQSIFLYGYEITPIAAEHGVAACGYIILCDGFGCLLTGDTYYTPQLAERINADDRIRSLIVETSFPSSLEKLAEQSRHMTPKLLEKLLKQLNRPLAIYPYHLKPAYQETILDELNRRQIRPLISRILQRGDQLDVFRATPQVTPL
ncbi:3',5'-cyclic-nucleotide phosphodiesterase [Thiomicrorhabdus cannonii]|uniref:3',5'-cyclic-nucleotide phosphodiesterase n=1 Tax=Thiomicrorhabdus cannonii TaxID=2748011 RepID=UPI0015BEA116|nr:3',5'-cyclic-nucleotide phosphodiesterase [Thiomicrorhabdus cannonii]